MTISGTLTPSENDLGTTNCDILKRISFLAATEPMLLKIKQKLNYVGCRFTTSAEFS